MQCREARQLIYAYLDGELSGAREQEFQAHLEACPHCRAEAAQYRAIAGALRHMATPVTPPEDFAAGVMERLAQEPATERTSKPVQKGFSGWWGNLSVAWRRGLAVAASAIILLGSTAGFAARYGWLPAGMHAPPMIADKNAAPSGKGPGPNGGSIQAPPTGKGSPTPQSPANIKGGAKQNAPAAGAREQPGTPAEAKPGHAPSAKAGTGTSSTQNNNATHNNATPPPKSERPMSAAAAPAQPQVFLNHRRTIDSTLIKVQVADLAAARQKLLASKGGAGYQSFGRQNVNGSTVEIMRFVVPADRANTFKNAARSLGVTVDEQQQSQDISNRFAATLDHYQALIAQRDSNGDTPSLNAQIKSLEQKLSSWDKEAQDQVVVVWLQQN